MVQRTDPCHRFHCNLCCQETSMLLSEQDIKTIESHGFHQEDFCVEYNGFLHLKNQMNHCIFLKNLQCSIYSFRPLGCQYYPLIYDADNKMVILDRYCPYRNYFNNNKKQKTLVETLVETILQERHQRLK